MKYNIIGLTESVLVLNVNKLNILGKTVITNFEIKNSAQLAELEYLQRNKLIVLDEVKEGKVTKNTKPTKLSQKSKPKTVVKKAIKKATKKSKKIVKVNAKSYVVAEPEEDINPTAKIMTEFGPVDARFKKTAEAQLDPEVTKDSIEALEKMEKEVDGSGDVKFIPLDDNEQNNQMGQKAVVSNGKGIKKVKMSKSAFEDDETSAFIDKSDKNSNNKDINFIEH